MASESQTPVHRAGSVLVHCRRRWASIEPGGYDNDLICMYVGTQIHAWQVREIGPMLVWCGPPSVTLAWHWSRHRVGVSCLLGRTMMMWVAVLCIR